MKQKIQNVHTHTNMGTVMWANGMGIPEALKKIGIPLTTCGCYSLWGGCRDPTCTLKHNETKLTAAQVNIANENFLDGAEKLKKPPSS